MNNKFKKMAVTICIVLGIIGVLSIGYTVIRSVPVHSLISTIHLAIKQKIVLGSAETVEKEGVLDAKTIDKINKKAQKELLKKEENAPKEKNVTIKLPEDGKSKQKRLSDLAMEYTGKIPYTPNGESHEKGYPKYEECYDNAYYEDRLEDNSPDYVDSLEGLDQAGYLKWLFLNAYGYIPKYMGQLELINQYKEVSLTQLKVGDICISQEEDGVIMGVCIGFYKEKAIVSLCDSLCMKGFPRGCTRLCFIKSQNNQCLDSSTPENFTLFFRVPETE